MQKIGMKAQYKKAEDTSDVYTAIWLYIINNKALGTKIKILHLCAKGVSPTTLA